MASITIHEVDKVEHETIEFKEDTDRAFVMSILIITDKDGNKTEIKLFSDNIVDFEQVSHLYYQSN